MMVGELPHTEQVLTLLRTIDIVIANVKAAGIIGEPPLSGEFCRVDRQCKHGGLPNGMMRRLENLEEENARLKKVVDQLHREKQFHSDIEWT